MSMSNGQKNIFVLLLVWHKSLFLDELCNSCKHTTCFFCHRQTLVRSFAFPWSQNGTAGLPLVSNLQLQPPQSNPAHALFPIPKCFPHSMDWKCSLSFLQNALVLLSSCDTGLLDNPLKPVVTACTDLLVHGLYTMNPIPAWSKKILSWQFPQLEYVYLSSCNKCNFELWFIQ